MVLFEIIHRSSVILLSDIQNYTDLVYLVFIGHCYKFRHSIAAIIRYGVGSQKG